MYKEKVENILNDFGVPKLKGYNILRDVIILVLEDNSYLYALTTKVYPAIADKYGLHKNTVEGNINNVIIKAYKNGNQAKFDSVFGNTVNVFRGRPTNAEFIGKIVDDIRRGKL